MLYTNYLLINQGLIDKKIALQKRTNIKTQQLICQMIE
jgi:hypothetical protein